MKKLFVEDMKGYMDTYRYIKRVRMWKDKLNNKHYLTVEFDNGDENIIIPITEIKECFLVNLDTNEEYFRYVK